MTLADILAALQGQPTGAAQPVRTTPDGGLDLRAILAGAQIGQTQKSPYERTMRPGETRSAGDVQDMLAEVILAAGSGALPGAGPRAQARQAPASVSRGGLLGLRGKGAEVVGYDWRSKIAEDFSGREGGLVSRRVSDWDRKGTSTGTGRDIVHVFKVKHPDGRITEEGINSAQNILGVSGSRLMGLAKTERVARERSEQVRASEVQLSKSSAEGNDWLQWLAQKGGFEAMPQLGGFSNARQAWKTETGRQ